MVLHIGGDTVLRLRDVVAILETEMVASSREMRRYINNCVKNSQIVRVGEEDCKSYIITVPAQRDGCAKAPDCIRDFQLCNRQTVYTSPISAATLLKRSNSLRAMNGL